MNSVPHGKSIQQIVSPIVLSYLQKESLSTHQIVDKLFEEEGRFLTPLIIDIFIDQMREEHSICTENGVHYIHQDKPVYNFMLMTLAIGGLFVCPILLNL